MVKHRRLVGTILCTILLVFCGGSMTWWLNKNCSALSQAECRLLWGVAIASTMGGALFVEILVARQKAHREWRVRAQDLSSGRPTLSPSQIWFRSVARVVLASLLVGLPLVVKGALGLTIFGTLTGFFLDTLVRIIANRIAPIEEDTYRQG